MALELNTNTSEYISKQESNLMLLLDEVSDECIISLLDTHNDPKEALDAFMDNSEVLSNILCTHNWQHAYHQTFLALSNRIGFLQEIQKNDPNYDLIDDVFWGVFDMANHMVIKKLLVKIQNNKYADFKLGF
ncbi:hypothetical protein LU293_00170 [Moraxella nasovis]|uniref:hypothetical protein n=1 Tax=Moraxella nasovis TaxID=2904121 RepID=UPI001F6185D0|nr:hypothetical protein [Moraxella nasovis]UNU73368.1 hypothetical protein LU293_00170 [Moraxella nasovis]